MGSKPLGDGRWGQSDLAGNVWEWTLDGYADDVTPCDDCANLAMLPVREVRGGSYSLSAMQVRTISRRNGPTSRSDAYGARCARVP